MKGNEIPMSLQAKTFLNLLAGGLAGILAWILTDLTGWFGDIFQPHYMVRMGLLADPKFALYGMIFGLLLGLLLAVVDSLSLESQRRLIQTLALGAGIGAFGGWVGLWLGQTVYALIYPLSGLEAGEPVSTIGQFMVLLIGRALGYAFVGAIVGAAQGVVGRSRLVARQGALGGFLGGFLGGTAFQILNGLNFDARVSRLIALVAVGALAGFFVGVVQNLFKQAWIRVVLGKNEGKEYLISKPITTIGRGELSDIGLFGDPNIAPTHVAIESLAAQNRRRLRFVGEGGKRGTTYAPPLVNGQPVAGELWLADGDTIQLGRRTLLFHEKATRRASPPAPNNGGVGLGAGPANAIAFPLAPPPSTVVGAGGASPRYVGQELSGASAVPARPPLTTPDEIVAQMGAAPVSDATVLSPGMGGAGMGGVGTRLVCIQGPYTGQSFPLSHAPATIGRAPEQTIPLPADTSISRLHARITYADGRHLLADGGSSNGTFVNGSRVADARPLSTGDTIVLGDTALRYE
jgi:pSer/pThr/pTyr-binding forkhead associated (FHA) protein